MPDHLIFVLFCAVPFALAGSMLTLGRWRWWRSSVPLWVRVLLFNLAVLLFLTSLVFVTGEAYYRFFFDESDAINYTKVSARWCRRYYHENKVGFRDDIEYAPKIAPGARRISFVGDSFLSGHGIKSVEDRFPNLIRAAHPEWEIHVLAKLGFDTGDELQMLETIFREGYQADQVVLVYCLNDVTDILPAWQEALDKIYAASKQQNWLVRESYFVNTLYYRLQAARNPVIRDYYGFVTAGYQGDLWDKQAKRLRQLRDLVESHGGHFSVVTFPFVHAVGPNYPFQFVHERLDRFWDDLKVPHLDLLSVFSNQPPASITVNRYDAHPNEYANRLATEKVEPFIRKQLNETGARR